MKGRASFGILAFSISLLIILSMRLQHLKFELELPNQPLTDSTQWRSTIEGLPRGIVESSSDMELKPLLGSSKSNVIKQNYTALLAIAAGILQKWSVDSIVAQFLRANYSIILFHYDGNEDGWRDLEWSNKTIHILARNQTKWWFAKRFLHPDVVSIYDYIFLWDEDLGVEHFDPERFLQIMSSEGLEISQPALDPDHSSDIHHRITIRRRTVKVHRRIYDFRGSLNCSDESKGPPCTGHFNAIADTRWVEGMAPVFSRAAWQCAWHLIQNDLIHGWGLDMKLGYCAQGDRTKKVGVIDSEFVIHKGIPSLGGQSVTKGPNPGSLDLRTKIRRQSTAELKRFRARWNKAAREDKEWRNRVEGFERRKG